MASTQTGSPTQDGAGSSGAPRSALLWQVLLPLVLTILPLLPLWQESHRQRARLTAEREHQWLEQTRPLTQHLERASDLSYWVERAGRSVVRAVGTRASTRPVDDLGPMTVLALRRALPKALAPSDVWVLRFKGQGDKVTAHNSRAPGVQQAQRYLVESLFTEIGRARGREPNRATWQNRLVSMFGKGAIPELFMEQNRGMAFAGICQRRFCMVYWNFIGPAVKPTGAVLFIVPLPANHQRAPLGLTMAHWQHDQVVPAFLPLPINAYEVRLHPSVRRDPVLRGWIRGLLGQMSVTPGRCATDTGRIRILSPLAGGIIRGPRVWARIAALHPLSGHLGLLIGREPPVPTPRLLSLTRMLTLLVVIAWTGLGFWRWTTGAMPMPGIRLSLALWFFGLLALPFALGLGTGSSFLTGLGVNLRYRLTQDLETALRQLDSGEVRIAADELRICRKLLRGKQRWHEWRRYAAGSVTAGWCADRLWADANASLPLAGLLLLDASGKMVADRYTDRLSGSTRSFFQQFTEGVFSAARARAESSGTSRTALEGNSSQVARSYGILSALANESTTDRVERVWMGQSRYMYFRDLVNLGKGKMMAVLMIWDQDPSYQEYLRTELPRRRFDQREIDVAAFKAVGEALHPLSATRHDLDLAAFAQAGRQQQILRERQQGTVRELILARPSQMPGYVVVARATFAAIEARMRHEIVRVALMILAASSLMLIGGLTLANWLAAPVIRMGRGLAKIATGELAVPLSENRNDELGIASRRLEEMTRALRDRQSLTRFVAPQVLELVAGGDIGRAGEASRREVAILVTDIRSFTTLSETHPPQELFRALNQHLGAVTGVIYEHQGVIDRFIGDAVVAVFPPTAHDAMPPAQRAMNAAVAMRVVHEVSQQRRARRGLFTFSIGVGIDAGEVVAGIMGDPEVRLDYTVLGETVTRAGDLEALSKRGRHSLIVCSSRVRDLVGPGFGFVPLAPRPDEQTPPTESWELSEVDGLVPWMQSHPTETGAASDTSVPAPDLPRPAIDEPEDSEPTASPITAPTPANPNAAGTAVASPRLTKSQRSSGPSGTPRPLAVGSRWQRLALVAALFLLPLILVETALRSWASAREQQFDDRLASQLRADLAWMERSNEPRQQLGLWLRRQFDEIGQQALRSPDPRQALPDLVLPLMRRLHQLLPSLSIDLSVLPDPGNGTADTGDTRIVASQGTDVWFSAAERQYIVDLLYADLPHTFASGAVLADVPHWFDPARTLATEPARAALLSSLGAFRPLWSNGLRYAFSQPFISPRWWNHPRRIAAFESGLDVLASTTAVVLRQHLWGLLTFRVTPSDLTTNLLWRCAAGNLRYDGAILAIQPIGARRGMRIVPAVFRNHAGLHAVLRGQIRDRQVSGAWRCLAGTVLLDQPYRVVVARRTTRPQSSTDRIYELRGFLVLLWLALGLAMARRILAGSETWTWSLTAILSGTFLIVLLPALFVGMQLQERDLRERGDQVESEGRRTLDLIVARVDEGTRVYDAWYCALIERWLENAALFERIMNLARHQPGGSDSPAQPLFEKIVLERMRPMGLDLIMAMLVTTRDEGTFVPRPEQPINRTKQMMDRKVGIALLRNSLESMFRPEDQQATTLKGAVEAVVGAEVENFLTAMAQMLPPKISAHMLAAPRSQVQVRLSETRDAEYLYRSYLQNPGQPTTLLRLSWLMGSCFRQHLQAWDEALQQDPALAGISRLTTSQRFQPAWVLARPYFTFRKWVPDKPPRLVRRNHLQPPDAANVVALTAMSGEPTARVIGTGEQRRLLMAVPGVQQRDQVFLGEIPIGQILGEAQRQVQTVRWWLALLVVLTIALSLQVARRFLAPVLALADAAARITAGDFQARLPRLTGDSEFAVLARSFNAMADGVAEGRLLGRFVPEAALAATRDRDRSEQARSGVAREAVVVFVSLAGFKPLLTGSDAGELVGGLNATLQRFSRVIRQHGGEIDKFIGEKILAVFHPRDDNHLATPVQGALAAAEEIRRLSRQFAVEEGNRDETQPLALPVGIGIVAGPVLAGILGAPEVRLEYTVIGDTVNLASRLCDLALSLPGAGIVLDGNVARVIGADGDTERWPRLRRLAVQRVKGKSRQVEVHLLAEVSR